MFSKVSYKLAYANIVELDQTIPLGAVWSGSTLFAIPLSILRNNCIKANVWSKKYEKKGVRNFRTLTVFYIQYKDHLTNKITFK